MHFLSYFKYVVDNHTTDKALSQLVESVMYVTCSCTVLKNEILFKSISVFFGMPQDGFLFPSVFKE